MYNKIKTIIEKGGLDVVIQARNKKYCIFSTVKSTGTIRSSNWGDTIEDCKEEIGSCIYPKREIVEGSEKENWKIVKTIARQSNYRAGDMVRVRKSGEIKEILSAGQYNNYVLNSDLSLSNPTEFEPYFPEEEIEEMTLKEVCKEIGRNIKIIK